MASKRFSCVSYVKFKDNADKIKINAMDIANTCLLFTISSTMSNESDISSNSSELNDNTIDNEDKYEVSINSELQTLYALLMVGQTCIASYRKCVKW